MTTYLSTIIDLISQQYDPTIALDYSNPWELTMAVILSAQCTDKRVNIVTKTLFPYLADIKNQPNDAKITLKKLNAQKRELQQMATTAYMERARLESLIQSTGFYKAKAKNIQTTARIVLEKYHGILPNTMITLTTLPGIARKTANVLLGELYNKSEGIVVDTHVKRIVQRLHLVTHEQVGGTTKAIYNKNKVDYYKNASPEKIEQALMKIVPKKHWKLFPHYLVKLGRDVCRAQKPNCQQCSIAHYCPVSRTI